jgi:hypothetical protein
VCAHLSKTEREKERREKFQFSSSPMLFREFYREIKYRHTHRERETESAQNSAHPPSSRASEREREKIDLVRKKIINGPT